MDAYLAFMIGDDAEADEWAALATLLEAIEEEEIGIPIS